MWDVLSRLPSERILVTVQAAIAPEEVVFIPGQPFLDQVIVTKAWFRLAGVHRIILLSIGAQGIVIER